MHTRVDAIEHLCKYATLCGWPYTGLLCPVVGCHPLEEPWIRLIVACYFKVDKHASPHKRSAMLKSLLACTRRDTKRRETKALQDCKHISTSSNQNRHGSYGSEKRIFRYLRKQRSSVMTSAGGDLLRQLLTGRRVAVHKARHLGRAFPGQAQRTLWRECQATWAIVIRSIHQGYRCRSGLCNKVYMCNMKPVNEALHTICEESVDRRCLQPGDGSRRAMIWGSAFPAARSANAGAWASPKINLHAATTLF